MEAAKPQPSRGFGSRQRGRARTSAIWRGSSLAYTGGMLTGKQGVDVTRLRWGNARAGHGGVTAYTARAWRLGGTHAVGGVADEGNAADWKVELYGPASRVFVRRWTTAFTRKADEPFDPDQVLLTRDDVRQKRHKFAIAKAAMLGKVRKNNAKRAKKRKAPR